MYCSETVRPIVMSVLCSVGLRVVPKGKTTFARSASLTVKLIVTDHARVET